MIFVDISNYQRFFNFELYKQMGGSLVWLKASMQLGYDNNYLVRVAQAREQGLKVGLYHWIDPIPKSTRMQIDLFSEAIRRVSPEYIAGDNEQWWDNWDLRKANRLSDSKIDGFARNFLSGIKQNFPNIPLYHYTSKWFTSEFNPSSKVWINAYPLWVAHYSTDNVLTFSDLEEAEEYAKALPYPKLPEHAIDYSIRQFSAKVIIPGLNRYNGAEHVVDFNYFKDVESEPEPKPEVKEYYEAKLKKWVNALRVRPKPNLSLPEIRFIRQGETIKLEKTEKKDWMKLYQEEGYIHTGFIDYIE